MGSSVSRRQNPRNLLVGMRMSQQPNNNHWIEDMKRRLCLLPNAHSAQFEGCTEEEITDLEEYTQGKLPLYYREFLKAMGRKAGHLFRGSDALISETHRLRLRSAAERLLSRRKSNWSLPPSAFVFSMHQGYQFMFIRLDEGDDPPVYLVTDREPQPKRLSDQFTTFIENYIADLEHLAQTKPGAFEPLPGSEEIED